MSILDYFEDDKIEVTPYTITQLPTGVPGQWVDTEVMGTAFNALFWNTSVASRYFNTSWNVETVAVLAVDDITGLDIDGEILKGSDYYVIDSIDNVGEQEEVYLIGLRRQE